MNRILKERLTWITTLVVIALVAIPLAVFADQIVNQLDGTVDAVAEVMPLNVGGPSGSTILYVIPTGADGKSGCNLTGSTTLVVNVISSDPSKATVSPSLLTFGSCGDQKTVTVTPVAQGTTNISLSQASNDTGGTFTLDTATFQVNVAPPANTAPIIQIVGVTGGAQYEIGSVPAATCQVTDAEDGNSSFPATLSAITGLNAAYGVGNQTASCSYTDGGSLSASADVIYEIVDTQAPIITFSSRTPVNDNGWNNGDVTVSWTCSDSGSGVVAASVSTTVSTEGAGQSATGTCTDHVGNSASATESGINIDKIAPGIVLASRTPAANGNGWNNSDVTVSWTCSDGGSGVVAPSVSASVSTEGSNQSATGTCQDLAGNSASATESGINVDKTAPTSIAFVGGPSSGGVYYFGSVPAQPTCTADGAISGLVSCTVSGYSTAIGSHTLTASATDKAGNNATATLGYTVNAWTLKGFYQPTDMGGVYNTVKC